MSTVLRDRPVNLQAIARAHAGRGIEDRHFDRVAQHLVVTLTDMGVPAELVNQVVARVAPLRSEVVQPRGAARRTVVSAAN
jgi:hemoglobin